MKNILSYYRERKFLGLTVLLTRPSQVSQIYNDDVRYGSITMSLWVQTCAVHSMNNIFLLRTLHEMFQQADRFMIEEQQRWIKGIDRIKLIS